MSEQMRNSLGRRGQPADLIPQDSVAQNLSIRHSDPEQSLNEPLLRISWTRAVAALRRYKWLAIGIVIVGTGLGVLVARRAPPLYAVNSTVWISNERNAERNGAPIRAGEVLRETSWPELLTSFAILDKVVQRLKLNLEVPRPADSTVFASFETQPRFRPGSYELKVTSSGWRYNLLDANGKIVEAGILGDSVGRKLGFRWQPSAAALARSRSVKFDVSTPREAAMSLRNYITTSYPRESNILRVSLSGSSAQRITDVMNVLLEEFIAAAANLKKHSVSEAGKALTQQVEYADKQLRDAEAALESFRVQTITLPGENIARGGGAGGSDGTAGAGGVGGAHNADAAPNPVFDSYFVQKIQTDNLRRERQVLEATLAAVQQGRLDPSALWSVSIVQSSAAPELKAALADFAAKQASLRAAQRIYTDDHKTVRDLRADLDELRTQTIPKYASALIAEARRQESILESQVQGTEQQLRAIPARTTDETRLRRDVETRGMLYAMLKNKLEEATLAEATTVPDISVLDSPVTPRTPLQNRKKYLMAMAFMASIAAAIGLALLLDQIDRRFRYAEQATRDMGLEIIGIVPALHETVPELRDPMEAAHAREAFRSIRLAIMHSFETLGRNVLTISSPGAGDGKSLVSSNLALSFADANCRTLLVDGDIRRGELHHRFGVERLPGFVDFLAGGLKLEQVLRSTKHELLTLLPRGASQLHGPELLLSPAMSDLVAELERRYDVVIIDSPPLGAGIDPFVLGSATGSMMLVLRSGETDRRMAQAKLKVLRRLPVRLVGAVMNDTGTDTEYYGYYSYMYADQDERPRKRRRPHGQIPLIGDSEATPTVPPVTEAEAPPTPAQAS